MSWSRTESGIVFPVAPKPADPAPTPVPGKDRKPRTYIRACPRCGGPTTIGWEHESEYSFDCTCGGGIVSVGGHILSDNAADVFGIKWNRGRDWAGATAIGEEPETRESRAIELLKALARSGWECEKGRLQDKECFHCGGEFYYDGPGSGHRDGCDYLAAVAYLEEIGEITKD
jgi:hypothetical protein